MYYCISSTIQEMLYSYTNLQMKKNKVNLEGEKNYNDY